MFIIKISFSRIYFDRNIKALLHATIAQSLLTTLYVPAATFTK